ncbi:MAG: hypothetical protein KC668_28140 [Myxococcales bacterium]|nr:hypothetical protein [Myxococcales bacterium]
MLNPFAQALATPPSRAPSAIQTHTFYVSSAGASVLVHNQHEVSFRVIAADGTTRVVGNALSFPMAQEEIVQGTGRARQLVHTENRVMRTVELRPGETIVIDGFRNPCNNCRGAMHRITRTTPGVTVSIHVVR